MKRSRCSSWFVADVLESEGAAIEPVEPDGLDVLAPESVRAVLGWSEFVRLGYAATRPTGAIPIGLEGDTLSKGNLRRPATYRDAAHKKAPAMFKPGPSCCTQPILYRRPRSITVKV